MAVSLNKTGREAIDGCVIVVSKCPIPGKSKTRLIPTLGREGSASVAKAMLADVLVTISGCSLLNDVFKVLLYAPGDNNGLQYMREILGSLGLRENSSEKPRGWILLPLISTDLKATDLGSMLADALHRARERTNCKGGIVFLGMDAPELPLEEIYCGLKSAVTQQSALMCPADDGGYGMLCVPPQAPPSIFENVFWSHPLTAVSQLKALTDHGINVVMGRMMYDIDEQTDLLKLAKRLCKLYSSGDACLIEDRESHALTKSSTLARDIAVQPPRCSFTWDKLHDLNIVRKNRLQDAEMHKFVLADD